ncbi:hypothetical protein COA01_23150 [Bacillus cereus]|uniref:hypothetical protein n=1 Tax=Bacillus cereus TaxID=1396 RepID=UPI000BFC24C7|nr:hypothetical protein [Bacillus cereus]PGP18642.1 hypothetical protein COA01_23150 [Bacillus cereus]
MAKSQKYTFINKNGETYEIFRGKGFQKEYVRHAKKPFLNSDNEWESGNIRLYDIPVRIKNKFLQIYIKQQKLEYLFGVKFKKEDLLDNNLVAGFYEFESKYKEIYYYGIISLSEFMKRFNHEIKLPLLMETTKSPEEIINMIESELARMKEEERLFALRNKRILKINEQIEEERTNKIVYEIILLDSGGFYVARYTAASKKIATFKAKDEVENFIESNKRGDARSKDGISIIYYDQDIRKKKW